ncbi:MAG: NADH-quinone oxidoreductase subunit C [Fulvivirga sp.]
MAEFDTNQIVELIKSTFGEAAVIEVVEASSPTVVEVAVDQSLSIFEFLHKDERLYFDMLSCITGIDNGPEAGTMEVIYNLYSIPFEQSLAIKLKVSREQPEVPSLVSIWRAADWMERETYDLFGINFKDHPDLRRILLPADWEGYPLRKDYKHQDKYRGMTVAHKDLLNKEDQPEGRE